VTMDAFRGPDQDRANNKTDQADALRTFIDALAILMIADLQRYPVTSSPAEGGVTEGTRQASSAMPDSTMKPHP